MRVRFQIQYFQNKFSFFTSHEKAQNHEFIFHENQEVKLFIKGIILNLKELKNAFAQSSKEELIQFLYSQLGEKFTDKLRGEFSGFIWDKSQQKLIVFTNLIGSQRIYYYQNSKDFLIDSDLFQLKNELIEKNLPFSLDIQSAYSFLSLTNLLDNHTLISEVKKLRGGEQFQFDVESQQIKIQLTNPLENLSCFKGDKKEALARLDEIFSKAVSQEYDFDTQIEKKHFSLLSGGLDSRMGVFYGKKLGFQLDESLCFSHSNYWDEKIAKQIANDLDFSLKVIHLDGGKFIKNIDNIINITHGLTPFLGGVHSNFALQQMDFSDKGLIHSGHLGDAILGTYLSEPRKTSPEKGISRMVQNPKFAGKLGNLLVDESQKYETEELFLLHNRGFNLISTGIYIAEEYSYQVSPFMYDEFIRFSLSLPEEWKYNQKIYLEWINKYCKKSTQYIWERTLMKPDKTWKTEFGLQVKKKIQSAFHTKISHKPYKVSMSPYEYYYNTNLSIREYFESYFKESIDLMDDPDLKADMLNIFHNGTFREKSMVLTLLSGYKNLFK
jgi:asparagine synthase (glutamine-hydrolysing)